MSAFRRFGIERLSPSSINLWRDAPGLWTLRYLAGVKDDSSPAALRGSAVEKGLELLLRGFIPDEAVNTALHDFDIGVAGEISDEIEAERALIPPMLGQCWDWMAHATDIPPIAATQLRIETWLDGVSVPVIGYVDFTFMEGCDIDCKTTKRCPSEPRPDHLRQIALYHHARGRPGALLYVTGSKHQFFEPTIEELRDALNILTQTAQSLERFLAVVPDAKSAMRALPMQTEHYAFGPKAKVSLTELLSAG